MLLKSERKKGVAKCSFIHSESAPFTCWPPPSSISQSSSFSHPHIELIITDDVDLSWPTWCVLQNAKRNFSVRFFFSFHLLSTRWGYFFESGRSCSARGRGPSSSSIPICTQIYKTGISLHRTQKRGRGWIGSIWWERETCRRDSAGRHSSSSHDGTSQKRNKRNTNQIIKGRHFFFFWTSSFFFFFITCSTVSHTGLYGCIRANKNPIQSLIHPSSSSVIPIKRRETKTGPGNKRYTGFIHLLFLSYFWMDPIPPPSPP